MRSTTIGLVLAACAGGSAPAATTPATEPAEGEVVVTSFHGECLDRSITEPECSWGGGGTHCQQVLLVPELVSLELVASAAVGLQVQAVDRECRRWDAVAGETTTIAPVTAGFVTICASCLAGPTAYDLVVTERRVYVPPPPEPEGTTFEASEEPRVLAAGFGSVRLTGGANGMEVWGCDAPESSTPQHVIELASPIAMTLRSTSHGADRVRVETADGRGFFAQRSGDVQPAITAEVPAGTLRIFVGSAGHSLPYELVLAE